MLNKNYLTLEKYLNKNNIKIEHGDKISIGKHLKRVCTKDNIQIILVKSIKYGKENSYPYNLIDSFYKDNWPKLKRIKLLKAKRRRNSRRRKKF